MQGVERRRKQRCMNETVAAAVVVYAKMFVTVIVLPIM